MRGWVWILGAAAWAAPACAGDAKVAGKLYKEAVRAEKKGRSAEAYVLYHRAAALAPYRSDYWDKAQAIRGRAAMQAKFLQSPSSSAAARAAVSADAPLSEAELREARQPLPPRELKAKSVPLDFRLKGNARKLFEEVAKAYGLDVVFDGDYPEGGAPLSFELANADYRTALYALQSLTSSFAFPLGERLFMVAKDTQQKRNDLEPYISLLVPIPNTVTIQDAQEVARAVQQTLDLTRFGVDSLRRLVLIRGAVSKAYAARDLFEDLAYAKTEVALELEFVEVSRTDLLRVGLTLPTESPVYSFAAGKALVPGPGYFLRMGGGATVFGVLIGNGEWISTVSRSRGASLLRALLRSTDGAPATFHVGDRYPVLTGGFFGPAEFSEGGQVFTPPPQVSFEDLGLNIKITPRASTAEEVAMEVEAEFKVLAGRALNGIPVISNRKANGNMRLKTGEWGVVAGMMSVQEARSLRGLTGLSQIPGFGALLRRNEVSAEERELLILIKPRVVNTPASQAETRTHWVGPEGRLRIPL